MKDKIYLDEKGYYDYLAGIETLKEQLATMKAARFGLKSIYTDPDSLNEALEQHKRQEVKLKEKLIARREDLSRIVIVERDLGSSEVIDINDTVNVLLDGDEMTFTLVTGTPDFDAEIPKITVDSPLGNKLPRCYSRINYIFELQKCNELKDDPTAQNKFEILRQYVEKDSLYYCCERNLKNLFNYGPSVIDPPKITVDTVYAYLQEMRLL